MSLVAADEVAGIVFKSHVGHMLTGIKLKFAYNLLLPNFLTCF